MTALKLSFLFFYLRIFTPTRLENWVRLIIAIQVAASLAFTFATIFQCTPISYAWNNWDGESKGHCVNISAATWSLAIFTIVLDITVLILPIPELRRLIMNRTKKIYVMLMFGLGILYVPIPEEKDHVSRIADCNQCHYR
jgi:hypothetical protein